MIKKKLLILTQILDIQDPILGFFHEWVKKLAPHYESVTVICLKKGEYNLPGNVGVLSLGKEEGQFRVRYVYRFFKYIFRLGRYDNVFVHMNEEYVLLAGWLWRLFGKKVSLWRNHKQGTWRTRVAVFFAHTVFFTSPDSYTARFKKAVQMPVGIDTDRFYPEEVEKKKDTILYVGRISRVKNIECLIDSISLLQKRDISYSVDIFGPVLDIEYFEFLKSRIKEQNLSEKVFFRGAVTQEELPEIYRRYDICVNMTKSGSFDKTIFESTLCGALPIVANEAFSLLINRIYRDVISFEENNAESLSERLYNVKILSPYFKTEIIQDITHLIQKEHSLSILINRLIRKTI